MVLVLLAGVMLGLLARNGKSHAVFRFAPLKSKSKWKLEDGDVSCGVEGLENDGGEYGNAGVFERCSNFDASKHSGEGSATPEKCPGDFNVSRSSAP